MVNYGASSRHLHPKNVIYTHPHLVSNNNDTDKRIVVDNNGNYNFNDLGLENGLFGFSIFNMSNYAQESQYGLAYITNESLYNLLSEQSITCIRFPMCIWGRDYGFGDKAYLNPQGDIADISTDIPDQIVEGIKLAAAKQIYTIVDWHTYGLEQNTDNKNIEGNNKHSEFFKTIIEKINETNNSISDYVIWEIFNEPNGSVNIDNNEWINDNYPLQQITAIRTAEENNGWEPHLIIVGTTNFSQLKTPPPPSFDKPGGLPDVSNVENIAFAMHMYAQSHDANSVQQQWGYDSNTGKVNYNGKTYAVFISEWGPYMADGNWNNNNPEYDSATELWNTLKIKENQVPNCAWAIGGNPDYTPAQVLNELPTSKSFSFNNNGDEILKIIR